MKTPHTRIEPPLESRPPLSLCEEQNAKADLAKNHRIDRDLALISSQPIDDGLVRFRFGRFAQDVRVNEKSHNVSVDSDAMGTKKSFSGHSSSQSITPSFDRALRRSR